MHLRSDSFRPYDVLDARLALGEHDPESHVRLAGNRNPHLAWSNAPEGTRSFALLVVDVDVPSTGDSVNQEGVTVPLDLPRVDFFHWVIVDLPAELREIPEGSHASGVIPRGKDAGSTPHGGVHGLNDYTGWFAGDAEMAGDYYGYDGPCPPWNDERVHGYHFVIYALDVPTLGLSGRFTGAEALAAMEGHVLASARLVGLYAIRPGTLQRS
ncbi:MAG TPA: YbhB/YbcL family Raf kinase inhibitor-like protein [Deltaproteobacteria bacterium]|nr:YbhB/YbcL family Raf kinase inhibitor-like protein [Deltaproteobacteria bacterium]